MSETITPAEIINTESDGQFPCSLCASVVIVPRFLVKTASERGVMCDACCDKDASETLAKAIASSKEMRAQQWAQVCPPGYLETKAEKLPNGNRLKKVMEWQYGPRGLFLIGQTRTGKSRCLWLLARREFMAGKNVRCLDYAGALEYGARFSDGAKDAERWINNFCKCDILILDDVFKSKLSDSYEQAIFVIIARRSEMQLPVLATANDNAETLKSRMTDDRGPAILSRLKEFCATLVFGL